MRPTKQQCANQVVPVPGPICTRKGDLKSKTPRSLSGRAFLRGRVYTTFYFFVKGNLQLFLFFLEVVSFQEHSSQIPSSIHPCAALSARGSDASHGGPHAELLASSDLHAGSLGSAHLQSPGPHRSRARADREARRAPQQRLFRFLRITSLGKSRND